jgi:hypothetical protein
MMHRGLQPIDFQEFLVERNALTEGQLLDVLAEHWQTRDALGDCIVRRGYLGAEEVDRLRRAFEELDEVYV